MNIMLVSEVVATVFYCVVLYSHLAEARQIIISPEYTEVNCTEEAVECFPLSKLYTDSPDSLELSSNTTIMFLSGVHLMRSNILIRDREGLTLLFEMDSEIHCDERARLAFVNITNLHIIGLTLTNCGAEISETLAEEALFIQTETVLTIEKGLKAAIFAVNIRDFHMDHANINGSHGYGLLGINIVGDSFVNDTLINSSNTNSLTDHCTTPGLEISEAAECLGGNALFVYNDFPGCPAAIDYHTLTVINSSFSHGLDPIGGFQDYISRGCGLGVIVSQKYYDIHVKLVNSTFKSNIARSFGSNLYIRLIITETNSSVSIHNCQILLGRCNYSDADYTPYSSLVFLHGLYATSLGNYKTCPQTDLYLSGVVSSCDGEKPLSLIHI